MRLDFLPIRNVGDAIRWSCLLEVTSPKVGNVHPGASFDDLDYGDFAHAADVTAVELLQIDRPIGQRIESAVEKSSRNQTNVNLGIVLLLAPMIGPARRGHLDPVSIGQEIDHWTDRDAANIYATIANSRAGGLGTPGRMDVKSSTTLRHPPALADAMAAAADRDRIARQYVCRFSDLFENVVPVLRRNIDRRGDVLWGVCDAAIALMAQQPDSLIARKMGHARAEQVRRLAASTNVDDADSVGRLDAFLRRDGNRYNPGTTADLIAAGLFIIFASSIHTATAIKR